MTVSIVAHVFCAVLGLGIETLLHEVKYPGYKPYKQIDWVFCHAAKTVALSRRLLIMIHN